MAGALYISYNPALGPLLQSQGIPHISAIASKGLPVILLSFERRHWSAEERQRAEELKARLRAAGVRWIYFRYITFPLGFGSTLDVLRGALAAWFLIASHDLRLVHCRSYIPAVMALLIKPFARFRMIFDMRGFMTEEYRHEGHWHAGGWRYRTAKWLERILLRFSDSIVVNNIFFEKAVCEMLVAAKINKPIYVVQNCVDLSRFWKTTPMCGPLTLFFSGSSATYQMFPQMLDFFQVLAGFRSDARMVLYVYGEPSSVVALVESRGLQSQCQVCTTSPEKISLCMTNRTAGIAFITPSHNKRAMSPIKVAEYLASGLPVVTNAQIEDPARVIRERKVGVLVEEFDQESYAQAARELLELCSSPDDVAQRCRKAAEDFYSLETAVKSYEALYREMLELG